MMPAASRENVDWWTFSIDSMVLRSTWAPRPVRRRCAQRSLGRDRRGVPTDVAAQVLRTDHRFPVRPAGDGEVAACRPVGERTTPPRRFRARRAEGARRDLDAGGRKRAHRAWPAGSSYRPRSKLVKTTSASATSAPTAAPESGGATSSLVRVQVATQWARVARAGLHHRHARHSRAASTRIHRRRRD